MAFAALVSALALLASGPSGFILAQADAPPAAAQGPVSTTDITPDAQANAEAVANGEDPFPSGAPTDDYGFMGWCYGALAGHMGLYETVLPNVRSIEASFPDSNRSLDDVMKDYSAQHDEGVRLLANWDKALSVLEATGKTRGVERAAAVAKGREVWKGSSTSEPRQLAQLWMSWGLPGRCMSTADRLAPKSAP